MSKAKVLLAENSNIVLQIEKRCLRDAGVTIFTAGDGEEALRVARKVRPDLVYLALSLPGMGGAACCRALKSDPELGRIPVVMVCAAGGEEQELCRAAGCDAVVARPVDRREFLETGLSFLLKSARGGDRMPCRATVACYTGTTVFYGTIEDISANGMFVGSPCEVAPGDVVTMKFILPWSGAVLIETGAQVAWVNGSKRQRSNHLPPGFGVLFQGLEVDAAEQIKDFLELSRLRLDPVRSQGG